MLHPAIQVLHKDVKLTLTDRRVKGEQEKMESEGVQSPEARNKEDKDKDGMVFMNQYEVKKYLLTSDPPPRRNLANGEYARGSAGHRA